MPSNPISDDRITGKLAAMASSAAREEPTKISVAASRSGISVRSPSMRTLPGNSRFTRSAIRRTSASFFPPPTTVKRRAHPGNLRISSGAARQSASAVCAVSSSSRLAASTRRYLDGTCGGTSVKTPLRTIVTSCGSIAYCRTQCSATSSLTAMVRSPLAVRACGNGNLSYMPCTVTARGGNHGLPLSILQTSAGIRP